MSCDLTPDIIISIFQSQERRKHREGKQQLYACVKGLLLPSNLFVQNTHTHTQWLLCLREGRSYIHDVKDKMNFVGTGVLEGGKRLPKADSC